ncbi:DHA2 family efflux MFS transporter permease subunit [Robbsia sp. KACC 23696]|uniref:DHA2 family efflux MFS transporter permease subunit n=1 Tax=Robbsia sp. KACC 23696 TaxID=3149231 RepID=UPI00325B735F
MSTTHSPHPSPSPQPVSAPTLNFKDALCAMLGIATVLMMSALDQTVIGNALPSIAADLHGFSLYAWVATSYLLASIVTIPIFGKLGDAYGRKSFVLSAAILFTVASLLCALAPSMSMLVLARFLQGIGGGMMIGTAFACIPELFPDTARRLRWQMLLSALFSVVNAFGPTLGGVLTQHYSWRSVFYLNLPFGVIATFLVWRFLPSVPPAAGAPKRIDWLGAALLTVLLSALQIAVQWLPTEGFDGRTIGLLLLTLVALIALIAWERRASDPLLPAVLFSDRQLRTIFLLAALAGGIMFVMLFYMPMLLQGVLSYTPQDAGLLITPLVLCITLGAIVNGRIVTKLHNPNRLVVFGFTMLLLASVGLLTSTRHATFLTLLVLMFAAGIGFGFIYLNLTVFTQTLAPRVHLGIATAMTQSIRLVGGMLGTALVGSIVDACYRKGVVDGFAAHHWLARIAPYTDPKILFPGADRSMLTGQSAELSAMGQIAREALAHALLIGFSLSSVLALAGLMLVIKLNPVVLPGKKSTS